jgi:glucose-1-phosphate adenylyltransferase
VRGATIKRCLMMGADANYPDAGRGAPPVGVGEGTYIENAIIDKNARIGRKVRIVNRTGIDELVTPQWTIRDGIVVIPKNGIIPDGTEI